MMNELGIDNDKLALTNEENNEGVITSSIHLTDEVKIIFDNLINEQFRHQDYQSDCFEELLKIWFGENLIVTSSTLDIKKETEIFEYNFKDYILKTISKYLPNGENELYLAYYSLKNTGEYTDGECTIYHKNQIDLKQYSRYIDKLNEKILRQYKIIKNNFGIYLTDKLEEAEFYKLNNDPVLFQLRRSARNTTKKDYKPMLSFNKTKNTIKKSITYYLKTNVTSNTTLKKRKVYPFNDIYLQYIFDCLLYIT
jgi:hypothetical protein